MELHYIKKAYNTSGILLTLVMYERDVTVIPSLKELI